MERGEGAGEDNGEKNLGLKLRTRGGRSTHMHRPEEMEGRKTLRVSRGLSDEKRARRN